MNSSWVFGCRYFTGLLTPWKGILLYGPPGTGKVRRKFLLTEVVNQKRTSGRNFDDIYEESLWRRLEYVPSDFRSGWGFYGDEGEGRI